MRSWLIQHRLALVQVLIRMWHNRLGTLTMMGVIGIALVLPAVLFVAIDNLRRAAGDLADTPQISLFLALGATSETVATIEQRLRQHADIAAFRFISRDLAWQQLQQRNGLADIAGGLESNPLPDAYIITPRSNEPASLAKLRHELELWPGVEHALLDAVWVKRLYALLQLGQKAVLVIAGLLGFAMLIITGNSIRLQILTQREEIELSKLIGATDRFICRPFLYAGSLYGLGGGVIALLMLQAIVWLFNLSVADLARQYSSDFRLLMPSADIGLALVGSAVLLGWIGARWAVARSLAALHSAP